MTINLAPKKAKNFIILYSFLVIGIIAIIAVCSWLLGSNLHDKSGDDIKTTIISSVVFYGGILWLSCKIVVDIVLFIKKFKKVKEGVIEAIEVVPSKYKPDAVKSKQPQLEGVYKEKKLGDNYIRITSKEIVVVYDKEFKSKNDYYKSMLYTLGELAEEIRNMEKEKK